MSSVMIDRIATALWIFMPPSSKTDEQHDRMKSLAQVALEQMRHPTAAMCAALSDAIAAGASDERKIQAVINAALTEPSRQVTIKNCPDKLPIVTVPKSLLSS